MTRRPRATLDEVRSFYAKMIRKEETPTVGQEQRDRA